MSDSAVSPPRFVVLDSWRGIAAILVALFHFRINAHISEWGLISRAPLCVDFFFVLSGFVIFANYSAKLQTGYSFWRFIGLRLGRLYPLHIFILSVFVGWELAQIWIPALQSYADFKPFGQTGESLRDIVLNATLLHGLGTVEDVGFNLPSWTISAEFFTYALFALLLIIFKKRTAIAIVLVMLTAASVLIYTEKYLGAVLDYGIWRCIFGFSCGALLWKIYEMSETIKTGLRNLALPAWHALEVLMLCACYIFLSTRMNGAITMVLMPFIFSSLIFVFSFEKGVVSTILKNRIFVYLGLISYSVYMTHTLIGGKLASVLQIIEKQTGYSMQIVTQDKTELGHTMLQGDVIVAIYVLLVLIGSTLTYYLVERPGRKYSRHWLKHNNENTAG